MVKLRSSVFICLFLTQTILFTTPGAEGRLSAVGRPIDQTADRVELTLERTQTLEYLIALPAGYTPDVEGESVPLILFLHGAGERGDNLNRVKAHGPPKLIDEGRDFGAIVVSPQCPAGTWWSDHVEVLTALLDKIEREHRIDPDRIYITGLSMGGFGTFALAAHQPDRFAAVVPICGGGTFLEAMRLTRMPVWMFHGDADEVVPLDESIRMLKYLNRAGGATAQLTVYPLTGHDSWTKTYDDSEMWNWLLAQKR